MDNTIILNINSWSVEYTPSHHMFSMYYGMCGYVQSELLNTVWGFRSLHYSLWHHSCGSYFLWPCHHCSFLQQYLGSFPLLFGPDFQNKLMMKRIYSVWISFIIKYFFYDDDKVLPPLHVTCFKVKKKF